MIILLKKFYSYQKLRFPLFILIVSLFPVTLSSVAVLGAKNSLPPFISALFISIFYLLHIRIGDEHRDFEHDNLHHKNRPIQKGLISLNDLNQVDVFAIAIFILLLVFFGFSAFVFGLLMLAFTYVAKKEFFLAEKLRSYFFLYNFINLIQTALLQILIYIIFAGKLPLTYLVAVHFAFTFIGTLIFEFIRKINIPGTDGTGKDTYSWYLGFDRTIFVYTTAAFLDLLLFFQIVTSFSANKVLWLFLSFVLFAVLLVFALLNRNRKTLQFNQLMQLSFILTYSVLNLAIYFLKFN